MDYPAGWSMQARRKQPSLYDEYLSRERSNAPSSPRTEHHHQSSPTFPTPSAHNLNIRTASPDASRVPLAPASPSPGPSNPAMTSTDPPSATSNLHTQRDPSSPAASPTRDSPTFSSAARKGSLRRKVPPPISTGTSTPTSPHVFIPRQVPSENVIAASDKASPHQPPIHRKHSRSNSPIYSASATSSPVSATSANAFAERHGHARRTYWPKSSSGDTLAASSPRDKSPGGATTNFPSPLQLLHPLPHQPGSRPATSNLPSLPPSASQPSITVPDSHPRSLLTPSASQPAFAILSTRLATPGFVRPQSSRSDATAVSDTLPTANPRRILHLMKTLCGRMSGALCFRRSPVHVWSPAYCLIEELEGSLTSETEGDTRTCSYLISDLRGCRVTCHYDSAAEAPYLQLFVPTTSEQVHLKMPSQADHESWYAALLCWQPIDRKGMHHKLPKPQPPTLAPRPSDKGRQDSDPSLIREAPIVRIGRMVFWDSHVSFGNMLPITASKYPVRRMFNQVAKAHGARRWRRVSCTLRENGELKFFTEADNAVVSVVQLGRLSRDAIVRLDPTVMDSNHCIAIFPQYTLDKSPKLPPGSGPIYLSLESRTNWEVWFVLLTAFTVPNTYGPSAGALQQQSQISPVSPGNRLPHMFRMCQNLVIKVNDARVPKEVIEGSPASLGGTQTGSAISASAKSPILTPSVDKPCGFYVEITIDGQLRGRTQLKDATSNPSWRQEYEFTEIPTDLSSACIVLMYRPPDSYASQGKQGMPYYHDAYGQLQYPSTTNADTGFVGVFRDIVIGRVDLGMVDLESRKDSEQWWPVMSDQNTKVADLSLRLRAHDHVVMFREEYDLFSHMLHKFETGLTVQLSLHIPMELKRLSEVLVNIFQASGRIIDWLMSLIEEEVDGVTKDSFLSKSRYGQEGRGNTGADPDRVHSRELAVRDMNRNATLEANLLFRGNTLLTKALDVHMRRIGSEYLASAIGRVIEEINEADIDCEVDPNRVSNANDVQRNWTRLIATTEKVWQAIAGSADSCPSELKLIFRHIRACAEDKYGDFLRTIKYSSVSGFLFLRLFCPAVLNPKLFGLLKFEPPPRSRRSFTLVAKSLQTLANMATFGTKEYWMEPMNAFLTSHRASFKDFIDKVCFMAVEPSVIPEPQPAHSAPNTIRGRLPQSSKEGLLTLPYLIDEPREYANLVELWLHSTSQRRKSSTTRPTEDDKAVQLMQATCKGIRQRAEECLFRAEKARRPGPELEQEWEALVDGLQADSTLVGDSQKASSDVSDDDGATDRATGGAPLAPGLDALRISGTFDMDGQVEVIRATPPLGQLDWTTAPDGGTAMATAEAAAQFVGERSPRSAFVLATSPNVGRQSPSSPSSPALVTFRPVAAPVGESPGAVGPTSAPSSRPGSSLSTRAASRLTRMRSGPSSDTEESGGSRRLAASTVRTSSRRRHEERIKKQEAIMNTLRGSGLGSLGGTGATPAGASKSGQSREPQEREARESERQRIRDLVNGLTFGRRRNEKAAAAAVAAEKALASSPTPVDWRKNPPGSSASAVSSSDTTFPMGAPPGPVGRGDSGSGTAVGAQNGDGSGDSAAPGVGVSVPAASEQKGRERQA